MRYHFILSIIILVTPLASAEERSIYGTITAAPANSSPLYAYAIEVSTLENGQLVLPSKQQIFAGSVGQALTAADESGAYELPVRDGVFCVFGFADTNGNGYWDPAIAEPFGWYCDEPAGGYALLDATSNRPTAADFKLTAPKHIEMRSKKTSGGELRQIGGYPVLQLRGDTKSRGFAHGKLLAPQIIDFFRFYILEDKFRSANRYESGFAKFLQSNFEYPKQFVIECEAVVDGMRASGADLLVPELGREFSLTDLYAINGYIETRAMRSSCTQFAAWGEQTKATDVGGGMVTGRNMDGEIDLRKVTVSHFLLFAIDPTEPGLKRYVSMMWPGFVGTISGFNEEGFYAMENAGLTGPGPTVERMVPFSWTMRQTLARLGATATPAEVQRLIDLCDNAAGGACGPGCITLVATPYVGQPRPAFLLEGDRFGDAIRFASDAAPLVSQTLVASNHHRLYGVDARRPEMVFDKNPSFSSLWRYEAGRHKLEAWSRTDHKIGTAEMQELLQTVAHGTTEYAIITRPNVLEFDVATASMDAELWDAPYRKWTTFRFDDLFEPDLDQ